MKNLLQALSAVPSAPRMVLDVNGNLASLPLATTVQSVTDGRYILDSAVSAYIKTLLDDPNASTAQTTLGISTFIKTLIATTSGSAAMAALGVLKSLAPNGYYYEPGGELSQWGSTVNVATDYTVGFPLAFPNLCTEVSIISIYGGITTGQFIGVSTSNLTTTTFDVRCRTIQNGGTVAGAGAVPVAWGAKGY